MEAGGVSLREGTGGRRSRSDMRCVEWRGDRTIAGTRHLPRSGASGLGVWVVSVNTPWEERERNDRLLNK